MLEVFQGDCLLKIGSFQENSIDALITDPPAGISFMGKDWDSDKGGRDQWIAWMTDVMKECLRVLKPGAHGLVWALPRTSHWTATALEDAGFEIRDVICHLYGQGFPKSHNLEKSTNGIAKGQGTALKPSVEEWILVRKPCSEKTVAENVLTWGTGGLNIDGSRIEGNPVPCQVSSTGSGYNKFDSSDYPGKRLYSNQGRFPSNLVLSHSPYCSDDQCDIECAIKMLDEQSGPCKVGGVGLQKADGFNPGKKHSGKSRGLVGNHRGDNGSGASRFFYCPKVSPSERGDSTHPTMKSLKLMKYLICLITPPNGKVLDPFMGSGSTGVAAKELGFGFVGIEKELEYLNISKERIFLEKVACE